MRKNTLVMVGAIAFVLMAALIFSMSAGTPDTAMAAPAPAPTPVSATDSGGNNAVVTFWSGEALTATGASSIQNVMDFERVDLQTTIDQGTTPNTVTLKLQFSNDGTNWIDGATVVTANVADAGAMQQYALFGRYARLYATAGNSESVTVTAIGVAK